MEVKLLDRVRRAIRAHHYSRRTEDAYVYWIRRFIVFHRKQHPREMGTPEVTAFLTWLADRQRVSASTQNQALSAVLFLCRTVLVIELGQIETVPRARVSGHVPAVLTRDEVRRVLATLSGMS
jgi:site-specific recombinase XerD